jgi:outer membrane protein OmpA-like peptidoglycan-associated protein
MPPASFDWILDHDPRSIPKVPGTIEYRFTVVGSHHDTSSAVGSLPVELVTLRKKRMERVADREIERFNLVLFDLQSAQLNQANMRIIEMIRPHVKKNSIVTIIGHTDRRGDADLNVQLSLERARNAAKALGVPDATIKGLGADPLLYDNSLPEGRFHSRTVEIIVEAPAETM